MLIGSFAHEVYYVENIARSITQNMTCIAWSIALMLAKVSKMLMLCPCWVRDNLSTKQISTLLLSWLIYTSEHTLSHTQTPIHTYTHVHEHTHAHIHIWFKKKISETKFWSEIFCLDTVSFRGMTARCSYFATTA